MAATPFPLLSQCKDSSLLALDASTGFSYADHHNAELRSKHMSYVCNDAWGLHAWSIQQECMTLSQSKRAYQGTTKSAETNFLFLV
jgi:hypothetical protein